MHIRFKELVVEATCLNIQLVYNASQRCSPRETNVIKTCLYMFRCQQSRLAMINFLFHLCGYHTPILKYNVMEPV